MATSLVLVYIGLRGGKGVWRIEKARESATMSKPETLQRAWRKASKKRGFKVRIRYSDMSILELPRGTTKAERQEFIKQLPGK